MSKPKQLSRAAILAGATILLALPASAPAQQQSKATKRATAKQRAARDKTDVSPYRTNPSLLSPSARSLTDPGHQHGGDGGHLPATSKNVELVGKLEPTKRFGDIVPGQIADLSVFKGYAYLNSWNESTCSRGGVYVADIRDPRKPKEVGFIPALAGNYHGEGAHVIRAKTKFFKGDLLAVNNEFCDDTATRGGGFDLYDVSNPRKPKVLVQGFGDFGPEGSLVGENTAANSSHSVFLWQDGRKGKIYAVAVDNVELHDVDIFDVTDPRHPQPVAEHDLVELFPQIVDNSANGDQIFLHDMVVKEIDGVQTMLASYWDAGYVKLNVDNPATPLYLGDTSFDGPDPLTGIDPPEGNGHQSEFSADNRYVLAADEDFNPYRAGKFSITTGPNAGDYPAQEVGGGTSVASLPDRKLNGPVVYGGYGCPGSRPVPQRADYNLDLQPGEEAILVLQRGPSGDPNAPEEACFPGDKAAAADKAGWDAVLLVNRHLGTEADDSAYCGSGGYPPGVEVVTLCTTHQAFHKMFNTEPNYTGGSLDAPGEPAFGATGEDVEGTAVFDGWGYAHLYRNENGKMREVDAYAIPEALDPKYAFGFGDLSIHEFATDPEARLAYSSYYAGGLRVFSFGERGLKETGRFIDEGGNNFWGIEQFTTTHRKRERLIAASDRDFGLYLFRYTGPRAPH
ncbi:MAG: hypothetical protein ABI611_09090 [Solirubrobacteraceae bacterium]